MFNMDWVVGIALIALCIALVSHRKRIVQRVREFKAGLKQIDDDLFR